VAHSSSADARYGKTRLLQELAAQAANEGNIPCLLALSAGDDTPTNLPRLGLALVKAMLGAREALAGEGFDVSRTPSLQTLTSLEQCLGPGVIAPPALPNEESRYWWKLEQLDRLLAGSEAAGAITRNVLAPALRQDLLELALEARQHLPDAKVLVMIDEAHTFDAAAGELVELLDKHGLGFFGEPVPVVFAFSVLPEARYSTATRALREFLESGRAYVEKVDLGPFPDPLEDPVPYQQFLLHGIDSKPLVVSPIADAATVQEFYGLLRDEVNGIPSQLWPNQGVEALLKATQKFTKCLEDADDETLLNELRQS
jgi:hypothetical protein